MKIRYLLLNAYTVGGTVRTVISQANAMAAAGHDVEIVSVWRQRETPAFSIDRGVRLHALIDASAAVPGWRRRMEALTMRGASRLVPNSEVRYDRFNRLTDRRVVRFLQSLEGGVLVTTRPALNLLAAQYAPPGVVTVGQEHMHLARHKPGLVQAIQATYPRLDAVSVLTESDARAYRSALGETRVRIARIPNALAGTLHERSSLERPLVVAAGRLVKSKGFDQLIEAFAAVAAVHPDWRLRIFGSGTEREALRKLIHARHLYNHVYLMGATTQLDHELAKASMFVLSSRHEGFGMVLAEAMSHGVPVISYDCPQGPKEIISEGEDGLLVPPQNISALSSAINSLIEDEGKRNCMGEKAAESARRYDMDHILPQWEELFMELESAKREAASPGAA